jgi:hypothetical protein
MVREMEDASSKPVNIRVTLPLDVEAAERVAEMAFGTAIALLDRGALLVMTTDETQGTMSAPVSGRLEAGRRLARATGLDAPEGIVVST